jgi:sarcosine oxidase
VVQRQVLHWFPLAGDIGYQPSKCPVYIWHWGDGPNDVFYGFPQAGSEQSIKVATEQSSHTTTPEAVERYVSPAESAAMFQTHIRDRLRGIDGAVLRTATCLYSTTADANFIIDRLPNQRDTIVVSACSGHGFKHSAAIGEALATMAVSGETPKLLQPFRLR